VMDLSSREEDTFPDTSRDEEIARRLFADLNYSLLRPPGDGSVIVLSDSNEEEEVRENDHADVEVMSSSAETPPAPIASTANDNDAPNEVPDDSNSSGDEADTP
jgi:hypothetical protein